MKSAVGAIVTTTGILMVNATSLGINIVILAKGGSRHPLFMTLLVY